MRTVFTPVVGFRAPVQANKAPVFGAYTPFENQAILKKALSNIAPELNNRQKDALSKQVCQVANFNPIFVGRTSSGELWVVTVLDEASRESQVLIALNGKNGNYIKDSLKVYQIKLTGSDPKLNEFRNSTVHAHNDDRDVDLILVDTDDLGSRAQSQYEIRIPFTWTKRGYNCPKELSYKQYQSAPLLKSIGSRGGTDVQFVNYQLMQQ